jgi:DNA-damage-inducible protein J
MRKFACITISDAINMFLRQTILHGGLPFELKIPKYNEVTRAAIVDMEKKQRERNSRQSSQRRPSRFEA